MLFLTFKAGPDRYAIDIREIVEVLPLVDIKSIPHAPTGVAGALNYRGTPVPVVDLSLLMLGQGAPRSLSTRIVLVRYGEGCVLGLIAEQATETMRRNATDFVAPGVSPAGAPYLGPVATDTRGIIQWVEPGKLLPAAVRDVLFQQVARN